MNFLIIDDNPDNRFLVAKTLLRKFPEAAVVECQLLAVAKRILCTQAVDLVVAHRTADALETELVQALRELHATVPIIAVSAIDRETDMIGAGANAFQLTDQWLLIGRTAERLIPDGMAASATPYVLP